MLHHIFEEKQFIIRLCCIFISCLLNLFLLLTAIHKIFRKKEKIFSICLFLLILYLFFAFITPFYNILYRFIITPKQCFVSDAFEECLIIFTRIIILFFYLIRLKKIFNGTDYEINNKLFIFFFIFIISYSIIIPLFRILNQTVTTYIFLMIGIYCSNQG